MSEKQPRYILKIRSLMKEKGVSKISLAKSLAMSPAGVGKMLNSGKSLKVDTFIKICDYLGINAAELLKEDKPKKDHGFALTSDDKKHCDIVFMYKHIKIFNELAKSETSINIDDFVNAFVSKLKEDLKEFSEQPEWKTCTIYKACGYLGEDVQSVKRLIKEGVLCITPSKRVPLRDIAKYRQDQIEKYLFR